MSHVRFDPSSAVTFDLSHGLVHLDGAAARLLVPADALRTLCAAAGAEATQTFGRAIGEALGRRVANRLSGGDGLRGASADAVIEHLGGELSLTGLGSLSLERWGRALVLVVDGSEGATPGDGLIEAVLGAAFECASGKAVEVLFLGREKARARFLMSGSAAVTKVRAWLATGVSWGDALVKLHAGGAETSANAAKAEGRDNARRGDSPAPRGPVTQGGAPAAAPGSSTAIPTEPNPASRGDA